MAPLITAAVVAVLAAFCLGRVTSPWRPRPGDPADRLDAAVLDELIAATRQHAARLDRHQADIDVLFARRHTVVPAPLDRAARRRRAAVEAAARTTRYPTIGAA